MQRQHWQDWLIAAIGVGLLAAALWPALGGDAATVARTVRGNELAAGLVVLLLGVAALTRFRAWEPGLAAAVGVWTAASPWVLGYADRRGHLAIAVAAGVALVVLGVWSMLAEAAIDEV